MSQFVVVGPEIAVLAGTSVDPVPDPAYASCNLAIVSLLATLDRFLLL